jgi:hypothetical protein
MSATELEEVQALLERVLPDPRGFAGRLLQQAVTQYGQFVPPAATAYYAATAEDVMPGDDVIVAEKWTAEEAPPDINILLAAALGACECWGLLAGCVLCQGYGSAGWTDPDPGLFQEFVRPAIDKLPADPACGHRRHGRDTAGKDRENHQTVQGEKK